MEALDRDDAREPGGAELPAVVDCSHSTGRDLAEEDITSDALRRLHATIRTRLERAGSLRSRSLVSAKCPTSKFCRA